MKRARIAIVLLLSVILISGIACSGEPEHTLTPTRTPTYQAQTPTPTPTHTPRCNVLSPKQISDNVWKAYNDYYVAYKAGDMEGRQEAQELLYDAICAVAISGWEFEKLLAIRKAHYEYIFCGDCEISGEELAALESVVRERADELSKDPRGAEKDYQDIFGNDLGQAPGANANLRPKYSD